jgi:hypothetical protein
MSIEELLECPAKDIAAMSDDELVRYLSPYFPLTRPKKIPGALVSASVNEDNLSPEIKEALAAVRAAKPMLNFKALMSK